MNKEIQEFSTNLFNYYEKYLMHNTINQISINGKNKDAPEACKGNSVIYILYSKDNEILYVGESKISVKTRCTGDGSGSHKNKGWWEDVTYVKYLINKEKPFTEKERKFIEQAFSIHLSPKYYGRNQS